MSQPPLWLTIEPHTGYTQLVLSQASSGTLLKARLSPEPSTPGGVAMLLEALSNWQGLPLFAVLDADAEAVRQQPERWARFLGDAAEHPRITVEWSSPPPARLSRDSFFRMGDFRSSRRLLSHAVLGEQR